MRCGKILLMDCYFGISTVIKVKKVGKCAIFIEMHGLDIDLIKSSNKSCYAWRMGNSKHQLELISEHQYLIL